MQDGRTLRMSLTDAHMGMLQVVYEDGHMACVVKPAGMPTAQVTAFAGAATSFLVVLMTSNVARKFLMQRK